MTYTVSIQTSIPGRLPLLAFSHALLAILLAAGCSSSDIVVQPRFEAAEAPSAAGGGQAIALDVKDSRAKKGATQEGLGELIAPLDDKDAQGAVYLQSPSAETLRTALETAFKANGYTVTPDAPVVVGAELRTLELEARQFTHWNLDPDTGYPWDPLRLLLPGPVRPTRARIAMTLGVRKGDRPVSYDFIESSSEEKQRSRSVVEEVLSRSLTRVVDEAVRKASSKITLAASIPVSDADLKTREEAIAQKQAAVEDLRLDLEGRLAALREDRSRIDALQAGLAEEAKRVARERGTLDQERGSHDRALLALKEERQKLDERKVEAAEREKLEAELQRKETDLQARALDLEAKSATLAKQESDVHARDANLAARQEELAARERQNERSAAALVEQQTVAEQETAELGQWEEELKRWSEELDRRKEELATAPAQPPAALEPPPTLVKKERPKILINDPPQGTDTGTTLSQVTVKGIVLDNRELRSVDGFRWEGDRKEPLEKAAASPAGSPPGSRMWESFAFLADLRQGRNRIAIEASDSDGLTDSQEVSIVRGAADGQTHVVTIGLNKYNDKAGIPPLQFAVEDARGVVRALGKGRVLPSENVKTLFDQAATRDNILRSITDELGMAARKNDTIIIYFSGHGVPEAEGPASEETYLLPFDARLANLSLTALPMSGLAKALEGLPSDRTIFLADTCYSGGEGGRTFNPADMVDRLKGRGRIIFAASRGSEFAQERSDLRHGVFTHYLIRGIEGDADLDNDKIVTLSELHRYVHAQVVNHTKGMQNPQLSRDDAVGEIEISRVKR